MPNRVESPLTGEIANKQDNPLIVPPTSFYNEQLGEWGGTNFAIEQISKGSQVNIDGLRLAVPETEKLRAMISTKVLDSRLRNLKPLFITPKKVKPPQDILPVLKEYTFYSFSELWDEARNLSFEGQVHGTLLNLALLEASRGTNIETSLNRNRDYWTEDFSSGMPKSIDPLLQPNVSRGPTRLYGLAYGCVETEFRLVFQHLLDEKLIAVGSQKEYTFNPGVYRTETIRITPKGYLLIDRLRAGDPSLTRKAFLVCRFNDENNSLYDQVYKVVGEDSQLNCPILRVKDINHVDEINDRIFQEIKEATIVIVDLTDCNFNIGFEAGIALALNKPIVWTLKAPWPEHLPFDIQSHNILKYTDDLEEFKTDLRYRTQAALDKAQIRQPQTFN